MYLMSAYIKRKKVNSSKDLTRAYQRCLQVRLPYVTETPWLIPKWSSFVAMDTAVPQGPAAKEERPWLINASRSGAAQSWPELKLIKKVFWQQWKPWQWEREGQLGQLSICPSWGALEQGEDLLVDPDLWSPCRGGEWMKNDNEPTPSNINDKRNYQYDAM